jgi:hypothetical protein
LGEVRIKAVERDYKPWYMKLVASQDTLAIEENDCQTATKNWKVRVVFHTDTKIGDQFIGDESRLVQEHVVGSTRVGNCESTKEPRRMKEADVLAMRDMSFLESLMQREDKTKGRMVKAS